jgi:type II secretory pathway component PulM
VNLDLRQLSGFYQRLSRRERVLLGVSLTGALLIGLYTLVWEPLQSAREEIAAEIIRKERQLVAVQRMRADYLELLQQWEAGQAVFVKSDEKIELFPHIEATVSQVGITRDRIVSMNPQSRVVAEIYREESVELKLINLSLTQIVDLMYRIEKGTHSLRITKLSIKKRPRDPRAFDVTATVSLLKVLEG